MSATAWSMVLLTDEGFSFLYPKIRRIVHQQETEPCVGYQQGPRVFVVAPDKRVFVLFVRSIAEVDPKTFAIHLLAKTPVTITAGGDYLDGRIYFASSSHLWSFHIPAP